MKEIQRFRCLGDSGYEYIVIEYQTFRRFQPLSGPAEDIPGAKECFLSDGRDVNFIDDSTFQIVLTDEFIRKIS